ncbi:MAG: alanine--tRNA ligase [Bacteroidetes bacterium]|nr:alanine--tRNA ligase [Bacteroidota bacterium]
MTSAEIRIAFLEFFRSKEHQIVPSAPMVVKNDPTLMFTNAGMNQFKDIFLGNSPVKYKRIANTQKCLRVSGKHNDLEEVGIDTYHHTMFEMLGNWSFGDYFKKEAIAWSWELLTEIYKLPKDRLYVTVFEGDPKEKLSFDQESYDCWKKLIAEDRILKGNKKDNFWEMGDQGPCGPCTEIHVDLRSEEERKKVDGKNLVNASHPQVIEIWNNVFMEFNRKADSSLEVLPAQHVDTGMGFERLCMALQGKTSNYDTDVFQPMIQFIAARAGIKYGADEKTDIAMRVMVDHIRAITFAIGDGQLPSNNKAGYVIRRILRRAVRYAFTFLNFKEPFLNKLVPLLAEQFKDVFPEVKSQQDFIQRVVQEEEQGFLRTLDTGIRKFEENKSKNISGEFAFELYDTFGFPIDLTQLMAREKGIDVDMDGFSKNLEKQKERSRASASMDTDDWVLLREESDGEFVGYDEFECDCVILRYRKVKSKTKEQFQLVLNKTPFYAESGGQVGDTGTLVSANERVIITDTQKENNLIIHFCDKLPEDLLAKFHAGINHENRRMITNNHSATHLMHSALKRVLGEHVNQKGSLVNAEHTRFDFSHFSKVTDEEIARIEKMVNDKIRENIQLDEQRNVPVQKALEMGATALFGEKYGETVRVITFDPTYSRELCGGTHVPSTGQIGLFKIVSEGAVAAGVRRIEAITADKADAYFKQQEDKLKELNELLKNPKDLSDRIRQILEENVALQENINQIISKKAQGIKNDLISRVKEVNGINVIVDKLDLPTADSIKNISFELKNQIDNLFFLAGAEIDGKAHLSLIISETLIKDKNLNAKTIISELSKEIQGGGGGQPFYATAGGKNPDGIEKALEKGRSLVLGLK